MKNVEAFAVTTNVAAIACKKNDMNEPYVNIVSLGTGGICVVGTQQLLALAAAINFATKE